MRTAAFLRNVPILAGLSDELLEDLASGVGEVEVRAGHWILREGDVADSVFIVRSGRVEVVDEAREAGRAAAREALAQAPATLFG